MDRRSMLAALGAGWLAGCGGGGSSVEPPPASPASAELAPAAVPAVVAAPAPVAAPAAPATALSRNVALWGDSLTGLYQPELAALYGGDRQVFNGGVSAETSQRIRLRMMADSAHDDWVTVFWYGHNNSNKSEVKADLAASIASLAPGNDRFVVMAMLSWANDGRKGAPGYQQVLQANAELAALYPNNFLDIRSYLVGLYDPTSAQDVQDFRDDITPSSLRYDEIHFNDAGRRVVAARVRDFIAAKGW